MFTKISGGGDLSGFQHCFNTQASDCLSEEVSNCAHDHWASSGNIIISNNTMVNNTVKVNQALMVTGDDTNPETSAILGTGSSNKIVIEGNVVMSGPDIVNTGIILNALNAGSSVSKAVIDANYVEGT